MPSDVALDSMKCIENKDFVYSFLRSRLKLHILVDCSISTMHIVINVQI